MFGSYPKMNIFYRSFIKLSQPNFFSISISKVYILSSSLLKWKEPNRFNSSIQAPEAASQGIISKVLLKLILETAGANVPVDEFDPEELFFLVLSAGFLTLKIAGAI